MSENNKKTSVELPLVEPLYSTYHYQGAHSSVMAMNDSIKNHIFNSVMELSCNRKFLYGFTTPEITVVGSRIADNPYVESKKLHTQFLGTSTNAVIKNFLDLGWYVTFVGYDDYYIKGKSWYHTRHFNHDGLICGYNDVKQTFSLYAYDVSWIYRKFEITQRCLEAARKSGIAMRPNVSLCAYRAKSDTVQFDPSAVFSGLKKYLASSFDKYPPTVNDTAYGIVVHDYIAMYLDKLADGSIPHDRMDRRVFRMIWEHKKVMLERIRLVESNLSMDKLTSYKYEPLVKLADDIRMLYAAYHMKERAALLPTIREKLLILRKKEADILGEFVTSLEVKLK